jgi:hypothetical protein
MWYVEILVRIFLSCNTHHCATAHNEFDLLVKNSPRGLMIIKQCRVHRLKASDLDDLHSDLARSPVMCMFELTGCRKVVHHHNFEQILRKPHFRQVAEPTAIKGFTIFIEHSSSNSSYHMKFSYRISFDSLTSLPKSNTRFTSSNQRSKASNSTKGIHQKLPLPGPRRRLV